jgi:GNAT superfamily N-acetyltransferase
VDLQYELVEYGHVSLRDWSGLIKGEPNPFGEVSDGLEWRSKDINVGVRDAEGKLLAVGGATVATVEVEGRGRFDVVGKGGLIVRPEARGLGLSRLIIERVRELTHDLGPDFAMCFCEPRLLPMYARFGYTEVVDPVWVDQRAGPIVMPLPAMWQAIRPAEWPRGTVHLDGPPF